MDRRDLTGTTIAGRYRVLRALGSGGMGAVWLVRHVESLQQYALKTLHAQVAADRLAVERFLREARAAASLRSKHVVKVVDAQMSHVADTGEPMPFIVMELLEGVNLEQRIASCERLSPEETIWVLRGVARALDVAHQKGIVHRDLKPENIFIALDEEGDPVPKVCDFGIAKLAGEAATGLMSTGALGTQTGITIGTPMYMSPEQARSSADVGVESDQWAVGLIAFKALTGREYFSTARSTTELLLKIVNDPLDPPTLRLSSLPPAFDAWFFRSCARDPQKRWGSVGEQVAALSDALGVTNVTAPVVPRSDRVIATAETVVATPAASVPRANIALTGPPSSRTVNDRVETARAEPPPKRRGALIAVAALLLVGVGATGLVLSRSGGEATTKASASEQPSAKPSELPLPLASTTATASAPAEVATATTTTASAPTPSVTATAIAKTFKTTMTKATASATTAPSVTSKPPAAKLPKGAACARSSECASGFCVAEECQ